MRLEFGQEVIAGDGNLAVTESCMGMSKIISEKKDESRGQNATSLMMCHNLVCFKLCGFIQSFPTTL